MYCSPLQSSTMQKVELLSHRCSIRHAWRETSVGFLLLLILVPVEGFNIDTVKTWSYSGNVNSLFGQNVIQYKHDSEKGVYVTSPLKDSRKREFEGIFKCVIKIGDRNLHCKIDNIGLAAGKNAVPYPIVSQARHSESILTCQQFKERKKQSPTEELNSVCSLTNAKGSSSTEVYPGLAKTVYDSLAERNKNNNNNNAMDELSRNEGMYFNEDIMGTTAGEEQKNNNNNNNNNISDDEEGGTEIAIVLDGSGSIKKEDFQIAKDFISNLITKIWEKCSECEFAVVQYGDIIQTEFDLLDSSRDSNYVLDKIQKIQQVGNVTKTASALLHVLNNIFNESHGSKKNANKLILVLTDGDIFMDPVSITTVINMPKMQSIERFIIGVGGVFNKTNAYKELKLIATEEKDHVIRVDDYSKLDGLISSLQQRMIGIEGTKGDSLEFDLAETGFAVYMKDKNTLMLGTVGAFDWSGGLVLYSSTEPRKVTFLNESSELSKTAAYSYLGYSVSPAKGKHTSLYIAGAPRHSNIGKVIVFEEDISTYHLSQHLEGEQIGSYFGHQLCTMDSNLDGYTDFLLVGAPFYHVKGEEGRVYIYRLSIEGKFQLVSKLEQQYYSFARFGYSIATIGDNNQDGYQDIAIGAPLEGHLEDPDSFGSVYIYNSNADGIQAMPSQRIRATALKTKLQFFGQSVDGGIDLTEDGYPDIAVGALGTVMVLRSCPVVTVQATIQFEPDKIPLISTNKTLQAKLCFTITPFRESEFKKSSLHYNLELDIFMKEKRIIFPNANSRKGRLYLVEDKCVVHTLTVLPCNYDCYSDIVMNVSYTLESNMLTDLPSPVMDFYGKHYTLIKLQYEKDCKNKTTCIPDLKLATNLSRGELIVGYTKDLSMTLSLENFGDDSYMTSVTLIYPETLHFNMIKPPNNPGVKCSAPTTVQSSNTTMTCSISHPVFKASKESFSVIWQLSEDKLSTAEAIIYTVVNNFNNVSAPLLHKNVLPVRHSFSAVLTVQQSTLYVEIPSEPTELKDIQYTFNVNADNQFGADLSLELQIPIKFASGTILELKSVRRRTQDSPECVKEVKVCRRTPTANKEEPVTCLFIICNVTSGREEITVTSTLNLQTLKKVVEKTQELNVTGEILYNRKLFVNLKVPEHITWLSITFLEKKEINILAITIGSSIGGILLLLVIIAVLCKCGFFKRKYKNFEETE